MSRAPDLNAKLTLLRTAEEVFAERGLDAAKVEDISKRAGLSKGAFYLHFESKEEAFRQVVEGFLVRMQTLVKLPEAFTRLPSAPAEAISFMIDNDLEIFEFLWQNRDILRIVDGCHGSFEYMLENFSQTMVDASRAWIEHWQEVGLVRREVDPQVSAILLNGAYHALAHRMAAEAKRPPLERWVEQAACFVAAGIGTPGFAEAASLRRRRASAAAEPPRSSGGDVPPRQGGSKRSSRTRRKTTGSL